MERAMVATLEPELLRSFVAIAETGSFTAAAHRVHRTQSAVSMQIKRLEEQLGAELFARQGRTVGLTHGGDRLLPHARRILQAHREALAAFDREQLAGAVTLGAPDDYASTFLPRSLARFAESHARVHLEFVCQPSVELVRRLAERTIDLALVTEGSGERGGTLLLRERLVWVTSARTARTSRTRCRSRSSSPAARSAAPRSNPWRAPTAPTGSPTPASASPASMPRSTPVSRSP